MNLGLKVEHELPLYEGVVHLVFDLLFLKDLLAQLAVVKGVAVQVIALIVLRARLAQSQSTLMGVSALSTSQMPNEGTTLYGRG